MGNTHQGFPLRLVFANKLQTFPVNYYKCNLINFDHPNKALLLHSFHYICLAIFAAISNLPIDSKGVLMRALFMNGGKY
jgi:hypothetical protein